MSDHFDKLVYSFPFIAHIHSTLLFPYHLLTIRASLSRPHITEESIFHKVHVGREERPDTWVSPRLGHCLHFNIENLFLFSYFLSPVIYSFSLCPVSSHPADTTEEWRKYTDIYLHYKEYYYCYF